MIAIDPSSVKIDPSSQTQYHVEVLADRFGFVVINTDFINEKRLDFNQLRFEIDQVNETDTIKFIKVFEHLKVKYNDQLIDIKQICPYDQLLLTLKPKEKILINRMEAKQGVGRQHARWVSSVVMYKFMTEHDQEMTKAKVAMASGDLIETNQQSLKYLGYEKKEPQSILLTIESIGKMTSHNVLKNGIVALRDKLQQLKSEIDQGDQHRVTISTMGQDQPEFYHD